MHTFRVPAVVVIQNPGPHPAAMSSIWDFALLSFSVVLMVLSLLLLQEANKTTKWLFPEMPNPDSGEDWSYFVLITVPVLWLIWLALSQRTAAGFWVSLLNVFLYHAKEAAVGFVIAGIVPLALALFKLVTIAAAGHPRAQYGIGPTRPRLVPIVQGCFALANAAASVLMLLKAIA
jgi:hypothetical protein